MKRYIPKTKFDLEAVEFLKLCPFEEVRPDVAELLEWMQDGNWPVAFGIRNYLAPHVNAIKNELLFILNTEDDTWKYYILIGLIRISAEKLDEELVLKINKIAETPTRGEISEEVDQVAKELIIDMGLASGGDN